MLGRMYERENCSAARALEVVGERWSLLILRNALFAGATRFSQFARLGLAPNVLTKRLNDLVDGGLFEASGAGSTRSYQLTDKGRDLAGAIVALTEWGDRWAAPDGPPVEYRHQVCGGGPVELVTRCAKCGDAMHPADLVAHPGPGATEPQRAVMSARLNPPG